MLGNKGTFLRELVFCLGCKQNTTHVIASQTKINTNPIYNDKEETISTNDNISTLVKSFSNTNSKSIIQYYSQVIYCGRCNQTSLRNIVINKDSDVPDKVEILPKRPEIDMKFQEVLPTEIYTLYEEVLFDYENSYKFSCGASIRSLIELICKNRKHKDSVINDIVPEYIKDDENKKKVAELKAMFPNEFKNITVVSKTPESLSEIEKKGIEIKAGLGKQVKKLKKEIIAKRPLSNNDFDILEKVVMWGNENIHDYKVPTQEELEDVILIINFLLYALYVDEFEEKKFKKGHDNFNSRRQ
jgi:hypothetical protein